MAPNSLRLALLLVIVSLGYAQAANVAQPASDEQVESVALVRVHLPLTGNADQVLEATITRVRQRLLEQAPRDRNARRPTLVLQLEPHAQAGDGGVGSQFERVLSLSRFLCSREMAPVKTVAFVPRSIRGHGTLLALACEEIVMAPEATLGEAAVDESREGVPGATVIGAYREIAEARRTIPVALALGMIDSAAEVLQIESEQGTDFVLRGEFQAEDWPQEILEEKTLVPAGTLASFAGREGRQFGFVKFLADDRAGLARALRVPAEAIIEEDTLAGEWLPTMIEIQGPITPKMASRVQTMLTTALEQGHNWIGIRIDSSNGDLAASIQLATTLAKLDVNSVRTVAYVPAEATNGAAIVALACDQLVMHSAARLGARDVEGEQRQGIDLPMNLPVEQADRDAELNAARTAIRESLAPLAERNPQLLEAMIDPNLPIARYRHKLTGEQRWMSDDEAVAQEDVANWDKGETLGAAPGATTIDGARAEQLGIAQNTVESFDELKQLYRIEGDPPVAQPNWALELVEALASPGLAWILLMLCFFGFYIEMRTPGIGLGAFIGLVSIMLFFWSQYLNGTAGWLEVLLFVMGVCCIAVEVFVLPGFGIFGLGGGSMVLASIILASLTFVRPRSEQDMEELTRSVGTVAIAGVGMIVGVMVLRRYLPSAPLISSIMLDRVNPEEQAVLEHREMLADYSHLVGKQGVAATHLRPAGKAEIDHQLIDVIAEAEPLDRGTPLEVVDAHANRVVVRATGPA